MSSISIINHYAKIYANHIQDALHFPHHRRALGRVGARY